MSSEVAAGHLPKLGDHDHLSPQNGAQVQHLAAGWLLAYDSSRTRTSYGKVLTSWLTWCEQMGLDPLAIKRVHVDVYARTLTELGKASSTIAHTLATLSSFYRHAHAEEVVSANPLEIVRRPKQSPDYTPTVGLSRQEAAQLLAAAHAHSPRSDALINLLLSNGLRIGEALGCEVTDLGTQQGHRTLTITRKGGVKALVPLAPKVAQAIEDYVSGREQGPLFITESGKRWDQPAVFRHLQSLARKAGIDAADKLSPHSLRHTSITAGLDAGVSLRDMQDFAGHADPRTTRRYDRSRNNLHRNPTYTIASYLAGADAEPEQAGR